MIPRPTFRHYFLLLFCCLWLALIFVSVMAAGSGSAVGPWLYKFFSQICHQQPERSFFWLGRPLPVCHRCLGIYLGFGLGLVTLPFWGRLSRLLLRNPRLLFLFALPMGVDWISPNTVWTRFFSGLLAGFPVALFVWLAVEELSLHPRLISRRPHEPSQS